MIASKKAPQVIAKEQVSDLHFPTTEVLDSADRIARRRMRLISGMKLGNNHHRKVKIVFEDRVGLKMVETTIWASTEKNVTLKGGVYIPISRIHEVNIY